MLNGVKMPKLTDERLQEVRKAWTESTPRKAEATRAGRAISWWILDLIAHTESSWPNRCSTLELVAIQRRELDLIRRASSPTEVTYLKPATYHEAWIVNACGVSREWRVLDDTANPQNPLTVFWWNAG